MDVLVIPSRCQHSNTSTIAMRKCDVWLKLPHTSEGIGNHTTLTCLQSIFYPGEASLVSFFELLPIKGINLALREEVISFKELKPFFHVRLGHCAFP